MGHAKLNIRIPAPGSQKLHEPACSSPTTPVSYYHNVNFNNNKPGNNGNNNTKQKNRQKVPELSTSDKVGCILNNKYYLAKQLGSGACGTVYYAKSLTNEKEYAIKTMLKPAPGYHSKASALMLQKEQKTYNFNWNFQTGTPSHIAATPLPLTQEELVRSFQQFQNIYANDNAQSTDPSFTSKSEKKSHVHADLNGDYCLSEDLHKLDYASYKHQCPKYMHANTALYNEVYVHASVQQHPNVLPIIEVLDSHDYLFVVLEYCPLGDLFTAITERNWYVGDDEYAKAMFLQLLDGVDHCHKKGVYHCDLKPENIMVDMEGRRLKIADFGLASKSPICTVFGRGSSYYMAPETIPENVIYRQGSEDSKNLQSHNDMESKLNNEILETQRRADFEHKKRYPNQKRSKRLLQSKGYPRSASDVWALGVIFLNLIFGRNPWKKASLTEDSAYKDYAMYPDTLKGVLPVSDELNQIMAQIFHPDPYKRITIPALCGKVRQCGRLFERTGGFPWFQPYVKAKQNYHKEKQIAANSEEKKKVTSRVQANIHATASYSTINQIKAVPEKNSNVGRPKIAATEEKKAQTNFAENNNMHTISQKQQQPPGTQEEIERKHELEQSAPKIKEQLVISHDRLFYCSPICQPQPSPAKVQPAQVTPAEATAVITHGGIKYPEEKFTIQTHTREMIMEDVSAPIPEEDIFEFEDSQGKVEYTISIQSKITPPHSGSNSTCQSGNKSGQGSSVFVSTSSDSDYSMETSERSSFSRKRKNIENNYGEDPISSAGPKSNKPVVYNQLYHGVNSMLLPSTPPPQNQDLNSNTITDVKPSSDVTGSLKNNGFTNTDSKNSNNSTDNNGFNNVEDYLPITTNINNSLISFTGKVNYPKFNIVQPQKQANDFYSCIISENDPGNNNGSAYFTPTTSVNNSTTTFGSSITNTTNMTMMTPPSANSNMTSTTSVSNLTSTTNLSKSDNNKESGFKGSLVSAIKMGNGNSRAGGFLQYTSKPAIFAAQIVAQSFQKRIDGIYRRNVDNANNYINNQLGAGSSKRFRSKSFSSAS